MKRTDRSGSIHASRLPRSLGSGEGPICIGEIDEEYRERVAEIVRHVEVEAAEKRQREGKSCLGRERILVQDPLGAPKSSACSPKPLFHAVSKRAREAMKEFFKAFLDAYLIASAELREGKLDTIFPDHSFPPALAFCGEARAGP